MGLVYYVDKALSGASIADRLCPTLLVYKGITINLHNDMSEDLKIKKMAILTMPAAQLPVIDELTQFMNVRNIRNLQELLAYSIPELLKMEGFGYRCLKSLYGLLEANGCANLLREE